jgi:hypothetical protein
MDPLTGMIFSKGHCLNSFQIDLFADDHGLRNLLFRLALDGNLAGPACITCSTLSPSLL